MKDTLLIGLYALAAGGVVGLAGAGMLRLLRGRSILVHVLVLLTVTVLAVVVGVATVAQAMFLSPHDLWVVLVTVSASAVISLAVGAVFGSRLAASAVWAQAARDRERRLEAGRRELVAWVSHDLRTPLAGLRAMAEALEDRIIDDPATVAEYHRRIRVESDRMAQLVDDLFELSRSTRARCGSYPPPCRCATSCPTRSPVSRRSPPAGRSAWSPRTAAGPPYAPVNANSPASSATC